jgi:hypothetical protein
LMIARSDRLNTTEKASKHRMPMPKKSHKKE